MINRSNALTRKPGVSQPTAVLALLLCTAMPAIAAAQAAAPAAKPAAAAADTTGQPPADAPTNAQAPAGAVGGLGDINLYPKRVVVDDRNRVASVGVYNKTTNTGDYDITITDMMMTSEGKLVELATAKDGDPIKAKVKTASEMVRWSPHRFTLAGNESQIIRLMVRVSPDLPAGEYRTHFSAIAVPPGDDGLTIDDATKGKQAANGIGVKITPRFGISIPVIVRVGDTTLNTGLKDLSVISVPNGEKQIRLTITRSGTRSSFGDVIVTAPGAPKPVGLLRGVGVYTEVDERTVFVPVDPKLDAKFIAKGAKLSVSYDDDDVAPGKNLAKQDFTIP